MVVPNVRTDTPLVKKVKSLNDVMTCFSPQARISVVEVEEIIDKTAEQVITFTSVKLSTLPLAELCSIKNRIQRNKSCSFQFAEMVCISRQDIGEGALESEMDFVSSNFLITEYSSFTQNTKTVKLKQKQSDSGSKERSGFQISPSLMVCETEGQGYLVEGCCVCDVAKSYEFHQFVSTDQTDGQITSGVMCMRSGKTVLVYNREQRSITELLHCEKQFQVGAQYFIGMGDVLGICYSTEYDVMIVLHRDRKTISGLHLGTGDVAWQHTNIRCGSSQQVINNIQDVFTLPDRRVCIFCDNSLHALNPKDGTIVCRLLGK